MQAGATTSIDPVTQDSFSHISANIPFEEEQNFKLGNALFKQALGFRALIDAGFRWARTALQRSLLHELPRQ